MKWCLLLNYCKVLKPFSLISNCVIFSKTIQCMNTNDPYYL